MMKSFISLFLFVVFSSNGQVQDDSVKQRVDYMRDKAFVHPNYDHTWEPDPSPVSGGIGLGLDYGGVVGVKIIAKACPWFSAFGGIGLAYRETGYAVGVQCRIPTQKQVDFYITGMYGDNAGYRSKGGLYRDQYEGLSAGAGIELKNRNKRKRFWNFALVVPFRDPQLQRDVDMLKSQGVSVSYTEWPVIFSVGLHFLLGPDDENQ